MEYAINFSGDTVILNVLVGADSTLVGLKVNNSTVISMKYKELHRIVSKVYGLVEQNNFWNSLSTHFIHCQEDDELIVLETICMTGIDLVDSERLFKAFKLFHGADIFSCYKINYKVIDGKICFGGLGNTKMYLHARGLVKPLYSLDEKRKAEFPHWYTSTFSKLSQEKFNNKYQSMLVMYDTSYLMGLCEAEFVMLFTILEMLFGIENIDITKNIAKGTSKLVGKNANEKSYIRNRMVKLYDVRSRYVHDGKKILHEYLFELREVVRRVLIEILNRDYHMQDRSLEELRDSLLGISN